MHTTCTSNNEAFSVVTFLLRLPAFPPVVIHPLSVLRGEERRRLHNAAGGGRQRWRASLMLSFIVHNKSLLSTPTLHLPVMQQEQQQRKEEPLDIYERGEEMRAAKARREGGGEPRGKEARKKTYNVQSRSPSVMWPFQFLSLLLLLPPPPPPPPTSSFPQSRLSLIYRKISTLPPSLSARF